MSMKVDTNLGKLPTWMSRPNNVGTPATPQEKPAPKSIGETPPIVANPADFPELMALMTHYGAIQKTRRKLKLLSGKDAKIVLAHNTVGAADNKGLVYLGVEFLKEHAANDPLLAAVMAHEWGHLISNMAKHGNLDHLSWEEIFQLRREEEAAADVFCGRMLAMMGYSIEPITKFLMAAENSLPDGQVLCRADPRGHHRRSP